MVVLPPKNRRQPVGWLVVACAGILIAFLLALRYAQKDMDQEADRQIEAFDRLNQ